MRKWIFLTASVSLLLAAGCTSISKDPDSISVITKESLPVVKASINGENRDFVLDTAAAVIVLKKLPKDISAEKLKAGDSFNEINGVAKAESSFEVTVQVTPKVRQKIQAVLIKNHLHEVLPLKVLFAPKLIFDFPNQQILQSRETNFCKPTTEFLFSEGLIFLSGNIGQKKAQLIWDTGSQISVLDLNWAKKNSLKLEKGPAIPIQSASKQHKLQINTFYVEAGFFDIQTDPLGFVAMPLNQTLVVQNTLITGILGYHFIRNYRWYFDFDKKLYCFAR